MAERVDVITGYHCNSRCRFCCQGELRASLGDLDDSVVRERIRQARGLGDVLVLTGGEPTLREPLPDWVRHAVSVGFRRVEIQTNGRMLAYRGYAASLVEAGVSAFHVALHGHSPELHDMLTRAEGSFEQTHRGIRHARAAGGAVVATTVITRSNFRHLSQIVSLALSLGASSWRASFARPVGEARRDLPSIVPRYELVAPELSRALTLLRRARRGAAVKGVPPCVMGGDVRSLADLAPTAAEAHLASEPSGEPPAEPRVNGEPCAVCALRDACPGALASYVKRYGWAEHAPVAARKTA